MFCWWRRRMNNSLKIPGGMTKKKCAPWNLSSPRWNGKQKVVLLDVHLFLAEDASWHGMCLVCPSGFANNGRKQPICHWNALCKLPRDSNLITYLDEAFVRGRLSSPRCTCSQLRRVSMTFRRNSYIRSRFSGRRSRQSGLTTAVASWRGGSFSRLCPGVSKLPAKCTHVAWWNLPSCTFSLRLCSTFVTHERFYLQTAQIALL